MSEIPQDIMRAASECYDELPIVYDGWDEDEVRLFIANAIWSERQRCAKIAGALFLEKTQAMQPFSASSISQTILNQTEE